MTVLTTTGARGVYAISDPTRASDPALRRSTDLPLCSENRGCVDAGHGCAAWASAHGDQFVPGSLAEQAGAETGREVQALAQCSLCGLAGAGAAAEGAELEPLALGGRHIKYQRAHSPH